MLKIAVQTKQIILFSISILLYPALYFVSEVNIRAAYSGCVTLKLVKEASGDFTAALFQLRGPISSTKCDKVMSWVATSFLEVMTILRTMANKVIMATEMMIVIAANIMMMMMIIAIVMMMMMVIEGMVQSRFIIGNKQEVFVFHRRPAKPLFCHFALA